MRCKMTCTANERTARGNSLTFQPVYGGNPENDAFFLATPSAAFVLHTVNPDAAAEAVVGHDYYVDVTSAEPPPPILGETDQGEKDEEQKDELERTLTEDGQDAAAAEVKDLPPASQDASAPETDAQEKAQHDVAFGEAAITGEPLGG